MQLAANDNLKLAIGAILTACIALSLGDALIKQQSQTLVIWQIFVMRSAIAIPFLIYFVRIRSCDITLRPGYFGWTLLRSLMLVLMWIFYFAALPHIELAIAAAAYYTLPLFMALLAAVFLGQSIHPRGWFALLLGFIGTGLILQPQAEDFSGYALLPLAAALCYASAMLLTRSKCRQEKPTVLSLWLNGSFIGVGAVALLILELWNPDPATIALNPFLFGDWTPMWLDEWRVMAWLAIAIVVGSIGAAVAYQQGPASLIATFDFSYVGLAAIWGYLLFAEIPDLWASVGIVLIVIAGLIVTWQRHSDV